MRYPRYRQALARLTGAIAVWAVLLGPAPAEQQPELCVEQLDANVSRTLQSGVWGEETGKWRSKTQLIFDGSAHQLSRKLFTVWDPMPSRNLDFVWTPGPGSTASDDPIVSGEGHLVWRTRDRPAYDPSSVVVDYRGAMRNGRPDGRGQYRDATGIAYEGEWADGVMHGQGRLKLPNGDEYQGAFAAGRPHGRGRYIDAAGEIYLGPFVAGRRHGPGTTILPNGATYQSEWQDGIEAAGSRSVRLAQARGSGGIGVPGGDDVQLNLRVNPVSPLLFKNEDMIGGDASAARAALGYVGSNTDKGLVIRPDKKRLMGMWKGDAQLQLTQEEESGSVDVPEPSYGVFSIGKTLLPPLDITLEVLNRATTPLQITGAYLDISSSISDLQPAVQISAGYQDNMCAGNIGRGRPAYSPQLSFENFGWGDARNARIQFSFVKPVSNSTPGRYEVTRSLGDISKVRSVDFEQDLRAAGVDTGLLARQARTKGFKCGVSGAKACIARIGGGKAFGTLLDRVSSASGKDEDRVIAIAVAGILEYVWVDTAGSTHPRQSPFHSVLWLGQIFVDAECGDGSTTERITRQPLELQVDRTDYRIALPFQRGVPAGRVAAYGMLIDAPRSSEHNFTIVLQLADGREIRSRPINLLYFRPSWYPERAP